ncbi:hypothetical protein HDU96_001914 [Phlyctochytrium bullatum]|nr:hypothetical protein HDU96_001914 [Phlyctochytrium bullatum]
MEDEEIKKQRSFVGLEGKTTKSKKKGAASKNKIKPGYVYLGRVPHGFNEKEMRSYFTQFGKVLRLKLSRNKKTGKPKHYAFIEFENEDVAKIVAETMHGYLLFGHILQCKLIPSDKLHPKTFDGSERRFKPVPRHKIERLRHNKEKTPEQTTKQEKRVLKREDAKRRRLKALGIDYAFKELVKKYIRAIGFLYLRYVCEPSLLWEWFSDYLDDDEEIQVEAGARGKTMTMGQLCKDLLAETKWLGTILPRIPVPIARDLQKRLKERVPATSYEEDASYNVAKKPKARPEASADRRYRGEFCSSSDTLPGAAFTVASPIAVPSKEIHFTTPQVHITAPKVDLSTVAQE